MLTKLEGIRLFRLATSMTLKQAKDIIEFHMETKSRHLEHHYSDEFAFGNVAFRDLKNAITIAELEILVQEARTWTRLLGEQS